MAVLGIISVTLEVPSLEPGIKFYTDAGLRAEVAGGVAKLCCKRQEHPSIVLIGGAPHKRLHHISLRAADLKGIQANVLSHGGKLLDMVAQGRLVAAGPAGNNQRRDLEADLFATALLREQVEIEHAAKRLLRAFGKYFEN